MKIVTCSEIVSEPFHLRTIDCSCEYVCCVLAFNLILTNVARNKCEYFSMLSNVNGKYCEPFSTLCIELSMMKNDVDTKSC